MQMKKGVDKAILMTNRWLIMVLCAWLGTAGVLSAQSSEMQLRSGFEIGGEVAEKYKWSVAAESRFVNNRTEPERIQVQPELAYKFSKHLSIGAGYRLSSLFNIAEGEAIRSRIQTDVAYKQKISSFALSLRNRVQYDYDGLLMSEGFSLSDLVYRHALSVDYRIWGSRFEPSCAFELFHGLNDFRSHAIQQYRYTFSLGYAISRPAAVSVYYMINDEVNKPNPVATYVVGLSLGYNFL
jgi:hypothetical protein